MIQKRLRSISVGSAALHAALVSCILAYPIVALGRFFQRFDPERSPLAHLTPWWAPWLLLPVILAVAGTVLTVLFCVAYNVSARLLGGVRYTETVSGPDQVRHADTNVSS